jgi:hypothetical protein
MKWLVVFSIAALSVLAASTAGAATALTCNRTVTGGTYNNVVVPRNGVCTLVGVTVRKDVKVQKNAYFEADATSIRGKVKANQAQTIYTHDGSTIGSVEAIKTAQVFLYDGDVSKNVQVQSFTGSGRLQVCGMSIDGNVKVQRFSSDILVGDLLAFCDGNTIGGSVDISRNVTAVELVVRDNTISGRLTVSKNTGPSDKFVQTNTGGTNLNCEGNRGPFVGSPNSGFARVSARCS